MFEIPTLLVYAYTMAVYVLYILNIFQFFRRRMRKILAGGRDGPIKSSTSGLKKYCKYSQYKLSASPPPSDEEDESSDEEDDGFGPKKKPVDDDPVAREFPQFHQ